VKGSNLNVLIPAIFRFSSPTKQEKNELTGCLSEFNFPLCPAPSIDDMDRKKRADCLTPPNGGGVSACSVRFGDAQDQAGQGGFLLVTFLDGPVKSHAANLIAP
jgi:hypothetical protein